EMKGTTETTEGDTATKADSAATTVSDGDVLWVLTVEGDKKSVFKNRAPSYNDTRPSAMFAQLGNYYDVRLLPDAAVDGADCYVFEMKMKPMEGMPPMGRQLICYRKDTGLSVKSESYDANEKLTSAWTTSDIKLGASVPADHFKFEVPAGAEVTDATAMGQSPAQPETQAAPEDAPAEPAADDAPAQPDEDKKPEKPKKEKGIKLPKWPKH
ncbi:MAG TPA: hypothetical protein P5572_07400, partial [Phycisphaerae bacterium]|nr:hypothetical protein [Phycisphaerae bacterium]